LLESEDRVRWQHADQILDHMRIADGSIVADIAAGGGWFAEQLSERVGPRGVVYAEEIQAAMIASIVHRMTTAKITNVRTVLGTPVDPRLPTGSLDAALIVNAFHDIESPVPLLKSVREALLSRGLVGIVDFTAGSGGPGPDADERMTPESIVAVATAAGLRFVAQYPIPPFEFLLVFSK
jgi:predicted methyltransferase